MTAPTVVSTTTPQTGASTSLAVNMPASVAADDIIIVFLSHGAVAVTMPGTIPFTWKTTADAFCSLAYLRGADHISNGSPSSYTFTSTQNITRGLASRINGAIATGDPFDVTIATGNNSLQTVSVSLSLTTVTADTLLLNYDTKSSSSTNSSVPTGLTLQTPASNVLHLFTGPQAAAGSTGAKQSGYGSSTNHRSMLAAIKPAVPVPSSGFLGLL